MQGFDQELQIYNRQLKQGFSGLRFSAELETEFRVFYHSRNVVKQRGAIIVGVILLLALVPLDLLFIRDARAQELYLLGRVWIAVPIMLLALVFTFRQNLQRYFSAFSFMIITLIGVSNAVITVYSQYQGVALPYESLMVIIMVAFSLGGMQFRRALTCASIVALSYISLAAIYLPVGAAQYHNYFYIFATTLVGAVSGYTLEYQVRLGFLQRGALKNLAKTDPLTGLYNRGAINQKLNHLIYYAFRERKPITLLLVDVDFFKNYNDFYGHIQGDNCLIRLAAALAGCCKRPLDFAGRYGGEEFLVMWFDAEPNESEAFARRVRESIQELGIRHDASGVHSEVTISGGMVTGIPDSQHLTEKLLHQADQCLYRAKESGRNRIIVQDFGDDKSIAHIIK
ncbi:MAG: GGDEF domain-containing protein [Gammaproteobacteria bacterium]|nr:GGDEF domain-containing protein [Gammaproteobacteria bacterium]